MNILQVDWRSPAPTFSPRKGTAALWMVWISAGLSLPTEPSTCPLSYQAKVQRRELGGHFKTGEDVYPKYQLLLRSSFTSAPHKPTVSSVILQHGFHGFQWLKSEAARKGRFLEVTCHQIPV